MSTSSVVAAQQTFRLRIVESDEQSRVGEEFELVDVATIGRDKTCNVVLGESTVSRRHAKLEVRPDGVVLTDLQSGNGVWVGEERVQEVVLEPGQQFRVGSSLFECRPANGHSESPHAAESDEERTMLLSRSALGLDLAPPRPPLPSSIRLRVVEAGEFVPARKEFVVEGRRATLGRAVDSDIVVEERDVSRKHLEVVLSEDGLQLTDMGSSGGTWLGDRQVTSVVVPPGGRFRLGSRLVLEYAPIVPTLPTSPDVGMVRAAEPVPLEATAFFKPPEIPRAFDRSEPDASGTLVQPATEGDFDQTVMVPAAEFPLPSRGIEEEGELLEVAGNKPFLLDDPDLVYYVVTGAMLIFTVPLDKGQPSGTRTHFLGILQGQCMFGFDLSRSSSGFLAVAKPGTTLRRLPAARFRELATMPQHAETVTRLIDTWVTGLSKGLMRDFNPPQTEALSLEADTVISLVPGKTAKAAAGVLWVDISSGSVTFDSLENPSFARRRALFPVTPHSWIESPGGEMGELVVRPLPTAELLDSPSFWYGLGVFHDVVRECEFISKKLAALDEFERQQEKARHAQKAERDALAAISNVIADQPRQFLETSAAEPVLRACELVGGAQGMTVKAHPAADEERLTFEERVNAVASASSFRTRVVALRDDWYNYDHLPLLGQDDATKAPVALLPKGPRAYQMINTVTGTLSPVTDATAATLAPFAFSFYRPFPPGEVSVRELIHFGGEGIGPDLKTVGIMAVVVGMFGTVTPTITGRIFDQAIPQADQQMLVGLGLALVGSALASALFKLVQGFATVRVQARMEHSIQSAVWDRILNLPTNFFRKYSAGDLADRASGVDAIQGLISGAGVSAILGSVSGTFYVLQMFTFSLKLAAAAVVLTFIFVVVNWLGNYLQLTHQRSEIQIRGRLQGLVLNLITGVNKLRITGTENHAFRVWAQQFSTQKSIAMKVSVVQALMTVFSSGFPVVSSIVLFMVMIYEMSTAAESGARPMTTGEFIAFNASYGLFLAAMQALGDASMSLLRIVPIYERLKPILMTEPEVDPSRAFPGKLTGDIELSRISFRYSEEGPFIINDLSLKIKAGEFVAFVGGSGCGKSTLMRLMLGFERPSAGAIYYDGQDMNSLDVRLVRQQMGVVLQVSRVMPTEIYRNITGTSSRTIEDAWDAAEKAGLAEDIRNMPMGMHTYVSEGGGTLSGGQRQRLLIARAIVNKPKILFLDEATSALDNRAQAMVTESMDRMSATRIVIAHRLSTIINANKICYLEGGRIAEMGTYEELMAKNGLFAALARRQMA